MLKISDFVKGRNINAPAVTAYIRRHDNLFSGHIQKSGKELLVDDVALEILEMKYPLPAPVEVVEDRESRQKLILAQEKIIQLQEQLTAAAQLAAKAEAQQLLLDDYKDRLERAETALKAAEDALTAERSKTWLQRLFGR